MKKLLVLSVLLGLLVLPVFADHVSVDFGGDHTFGFIGDFGDDVTEKIDLTFDIMVGIDDYNSLTWSIANFGTVNSLDKALVTTDVGMWAGLPVGLVVNWGYDDPDANEFGVTSGYENEQTYDFSPAEYWGLDFVISYNIIEIELAFDPGIAGTWVDPATGDQGSILAGLAVKEAVPGLNAEVYYFQGGDVATDVYDMGLIAFGASYETEVAGIGLDAGATFLLDLDDAATDGWAFGIGVAAAVSMFDFTVGVNGNESDTLSGLSATAVAAPIDMLDIYAGLAYDGANSELAEVDLGINAHVGAVEVYVGYLIDGDLVGVAGDNFNAPPGLASEESGAYIKLDVDY